MSNHISKEEPSLWSEVSALSLKGLERGGDALRMQLVSRAQSVAKRAFDEGDEASLLDVHRTLYKIYLGELATPWSADVPHVRHPSFACVRHELERRWEQAEAERHREAIAELKGPSDFREWVVKIVQGHPSNVQHPLFTMLRDTATFEQMREFVLQETPLELLFGDVIALMLPGVYGKLKLELAENFWDEVGRAREERVHRNLRIRLMDHLEIPADVHMDRVDLLVREELALINMYLSLATSRPRFVQLLGVLLATETMIPGRFEFQIEGWRRRFGLSDEVLDYLLEHTTVDVEHARRWLDHVIVPMITATPSLMPDIALGVLRRLDAAGAVCDRLHRHLSCTTAASVGRYKGSRLAATAVASGIA